MNSRTAVFTLILGSTAFVACAPTDGSAPAAMTDADRASIQEQLYQMEYDWVGAYESGDLSALDRIFADDFIYTVNDGTLYDKTDFIALAEQDPIEYDSVTIESMETRWYGSTAVVTGSGTNYWTEDGVVSSDPGVFTNVFVERDGRWQVVVGHSSPAPPG